MFEYNVKIKKVSGRLNESYLPQKNLVVKSKSELSMRDVLKEAAKYLLENYGLELKDALIVEKAPRINGKWYNEAGAAEAAQKNHFIKRHQDPANWGKRGTLERLRDEITKELVNSVYFRAGDDIIHYFELPDGIAITLDGDANVYGSTSSGMHTREDATGATWSDQSYDADEKASDNVFTYDFDEKDFRSLINFRHNLDNEVSYGDYDDDDYNVYEMYDIMRIRFNDGIESIKSAMEKVKSFNDIEKCKQYYSTT